jgi:hypothetical protein
LFWKKIKHLNQFRLLPLQALIKVCRTKEIDKFL